MRILYARLRLRQPQERLEGILEHPAFAVSNKGALVQLMDELKIGQRLWTCKNENNRIAAHPMHDNCGDGGNPE